VFGDSLSDPGNALILLNAVTVPPFQSLIPAAPYARGGGHFSNGSTWIEQLALIDHATPSADPALRNPGLFTNYAVGGAEARLAGPYDLTGQINRFLTDFGGTAPAGALYVVWIGGDDLRDAVVALTTDPSGATSAAILQQAISAIQNDVLILYGAGARNFLVLNAPDLGLAPEATLAGPVVQFYASFFSGQFNLALEQVLSGLQAGLGVPIVRVDIFALLHEVVADPAAFGLTDVSNPCIQLNTTGQPFCKRPDQFLFWDGTHPTVAAHQIVAERADAALAVVWPH
ncbi:MAG TPA: SGNH/GDSL hydrolase family protein, partial [Dongiaceae bacterium]